MQPKRARRASHGTPSLSKYLSNCGGNAGALPAAPASATSGAAAAAADAGEEVDRATLQRLRDLAHHLESVREEERTLIAREIHDDLGHQLTALVLDLAGLGRDLAVTAPELLSRAISMRVRCATMVDDLRRVVTRLRPAVLDSFGLPAALEWQAGDFERHTGIATRVDVDETVELDQVSAAAVFRIFQEALTNVARHARATNVWATLLRTAGGFELEVHDDGRGFEPRDANPRSFGLLGMRERALALGGQVAIESSPGRGTCLRLCMPDPRQPVGQRPTTETDHRPTSKLGAA